MPVLLCIYETDMPTISILRETFGFLDRHKKFSTKFVKLAHVNEKDIAEASVVMFIRPGDILSLEIAEIVHRIKRKVAVYYDDNLLKLDDDKISSKTKNNIRQMIKKADIIISPNILLAEKLNSINQNARALKLDTVVEHVDVIPGKKRDRDPVKFVYAAGCFHGFFFEKMVAPVLKEIDSICSRQIEMDFIGARPVIKGTFNNIKIKYYSTMPLNEYRSHMVKNRYDYGFAILYDTEFMNCKYYNKFIEYSISGVCGLYSRVNPYIQTVTDGVNGILVDGTPECWKAAILSAIDRTGTAEKMVRQAQTDLLERQSSQSIIRVLTDNIPELTETVENNVKVDFKRFRIRYFRELFKTKVYTVYAYTREKGFIELLKKIRLYLIERRAY